MYKEISNYVYKKEVKSLYKRKNNGPTNLKKHFKLFDVVCVNNFNVVASLKMYSTLLKILEKNYLNNYAFSIYIIVHS